MDGDFAEGRLASLRWLFNRAAMGFDGFALRRGQIPQRTQFKQIHSGGRPSPIEQHHGEDQSGQGDPASGL